MEEEKKEEEEGGESLGREVEQTLGWQPAHRLLGSQP